MVLLNAFDMAEGILNKQTLSEQTLSERFFIEATLSGSGLDKVIDSKSMNSYVYKCAVSEENLENLVVAERNLKIDIRNSRTSKVMKKCFKKREREPSRISVKKVYKFLKKKLKIRKKFKRYVLNNIPGSSVFIQLLSLRICSLALSREQGSAWRIKKSRLVREERKKTCRPNLRRKSKRVWQGVFLSKEKF